MKRYSTIFLKIAVILIGLPVLALCIYGLIRLVDDPINPEYASILYPIIIGLYVSAIPFYFALYKAFTLLNYIDQNKAFSQDSVDALISIKRCAFAVGILYIVILPFVYMLADKDDAPSLIIIGSAPIFVSMVIAVFAAVLQRLLQDAIDIKTENDLTV